MITPLIAATLWLQLCLNPVLSLAIGFCSAIICFVWLRRGLPFLLIFMALGQLSLAWHAHPEIRQIAAEFQTRSVVLESIQTGDKLTKVRIRAMPSCPSCRGAVGQYVGGLQAGDTLSGTLLLRPSFGFGEFAAKGSGVTTHEAPNAVEAVRTGFLASLGGVSSQSKAIVAGLAIGDTSLFSTTTLNQLKSLSLTHLNAVSGANCAIVVGSTFWVLAFVTKRRVVRVAIALAALACYVVLVGGGSSVVRAAIMAALVLFLLSRGVWPPAALGFTVIVLLLYDPNYALDLGFTLSVFATAGILLVAPALAFRFANRLPKALSVALSVTVAAQLWCMPVLLGLQGGVPTYAVLANLLAEPMVAPITVLGILAASIAGFAPAVSSALSWLASIPAEWIVRVARSLSNLPSQTLVWHTGIIGMILFVFGCSVWLLKSKKLGAAMVSIVLVVEVIWSAIGLVRSSTWLASGWQLVNCNVGQGDGLVIRSEGQVAVVDVGREPGPIDSCLRELKVSTIDLLVLTHFDADHIAGLAGALNGRHIERALITPWHDTRPLVSLTMQRLQGVSEVDKAGIGATGSLGKFVWQVLSPTSTANEAEDSNDGSIAMRWESPDMVLYTMADLGERGQRRMVQNFGGYLNHPVDKPLVLKVSHHGSADQYPELIEAMHPDLAIISVGAGNSYGHPTERTLKTLRNLGSKILRTDLDGAIGVFGDLRYAVSGGG